MKIIGLPKIEGFLKSHPDGKKQFEVWFSVVKEAKWKNPMDLKAQFGKASILGSGHVIFDIKGNHYRLEVKISYQAGVVSIQRIGTHKEYMKWDT